MKINNIIHPQLVNNYLQELHSQGVPSTTINRKKASLNQLQSWAQTHGYIPPLPTVSLAPSVYPDTQLHSRSVLRRFYPYALLTVGLIVIILFLLNLKTPGFFTLIKKAQQAFITPPPEAPVIPSNTIVPTVTDFKLPYPFALEAGPLTVPVINEDGSLVLAGTTPKIKALYDTFAIEGQAITLQTPFASDGNITLAPDGEGQVNLRLSNSTDSSLNLTNANLTTGNLIGGYVGNDVTSFNFLEFQSGSAGPQTRFRVDALGKVYLTGLQDQNLSSPINLSDPTHTSLPTGTNSILAGIQTAFDAANIFTDAGSYVYPTNREALRVYDSTGTKYLSLSHDGTNSIILTQPDTGQLQIQSDLSVSEGLSVGNKLTVAQDLILTNQAEFVNFSVSSGGDLTLNPTGGDIIFTNGDVLNIGGSGSDTDYNIIGDTNSGASSNVNSDDDLYIEGNLEADGTIYGTVSGTINPGFTEGSVVFINSSGALAQDNTNFYWDDSNNRLGIGDNTPDDALDVESSSLGYNFLFGTNGITFSTSGTSSINVDTFGQLSLTSNQGAANALELVSTAGGIDISTGTGTSGRDIDILSGASINLTAAESAADSIVLTSSAGGIDILATGAAAGEDIDITATGSSVNLSSSEGVEDALTLVASAGGINISTGSATQDIDILGGASINLTAAESAADSIVLTSSAGGIDILATGASAGEDIDITATGSSVNLSSTEGVTDAVTIVASAGGIDISTGTGTTGRDIDILSGASINLTAAESAADAIVLTSNAGGIDILATAASAGEDIDIAATGSSVNISATESTADAITITTNSAAGGIDISTGGQAGQGGSIDILSGQGAATAITIVAPQGGIDISTGSATQNIDILGGASINLTAAESAADSIVLTSTAGGIDILASAASAGEDIDITATGSSVNLSSTEGVTDAVTIVASAGGIDISTGTGTAGRDIDILSGASINLTAAESAADSIVLTSSAGGIDILAVKESLMPSPSSLQPEASTSPLVRVLPAGTSTFSLELPST